MEMINRYTATDFIRDASLTAFPFGEPQCFDWYQLPVERKTRRNERPPYNDGTRLSYRCKLHKGVIDISS